MDHSKEQPLEYVCSDLNAKLRFDDVRKVHRDSTVFTDSVNAKAAVAAAAAAAAATSSVAAATATLREFRRTDPLVSRPMESSAAEQVLRERDAQLRQRLARKDYRDKLHGMECQQMTNVVLSRFMQICPATPPY